MRVLNCYISIILKTVQLLTEALKETKKKHFQILPRVIPLIFGRFLIVLSQRHV